MYKQNIELVSVSRESEMKNLHFVYTQINNEYEWCLKQSTITVICHYSITMKMVCTKNLWYLYKCFVGKIYDICIEGHNSLERSGWTTLWRVLVELHETKYMHTGP